MLLCAAQQPTAPVPCLDFFTLAHFPAENHPGSTWLSDSVTSQEKQDFAANLLQERRRMTTCPPQQTLNGPPLLVSNISLSFVSLLSIQRAVLNRLGEMRSADSLLSGQIRDGPGHFEDAGAGTRTEP